jgi:hypothetical protein
MLGGSQTVIGGGSLRGKSTAIEIEGFKTLPTQPGTSLRLRMGA